VARSPLYARHRDRLERWAADYPEESRDKLVTRLCAKKDEQHLGAAMELMLHRMLSTSFGFDNVTPDPPIGGMTPDFRVTAGKTIFIVELQTIMEEVEECKYEHRRDVLAKHINDCAPPTVTVILHFDPATDNEPGDYVSESATPAKIARRLAPELSKAYPGVRHRFDELGARFTWEVLHRPGRPIVFHASGVTHGNPAVDRVRGALSKKASKYKGIVGEVPFVVALASFATDELDPAVHEVLYGPLAMTWDALHNDSHTDLTRMAARGYVTGKDPHSHLSAVLTLGPDFDSFHGGYIFHVGVVHNPFARTRLPSEVFGETIQSMPTEIASGRYEERVVGVNAYVVPD
jgi:hypothetical protein